MFLLEFLWGLHLDIGINSFVRYCFNKNKNKNVKENYSPSDGVAVGDFDGETECVSVGSALGVVVG